MISHKFSDYENIWVGASPTHVNSLPRKQSTCTCLLFLIQYILLMNFNTFSKVTLSLKSDHTFVCLYVVRTVETRTELTAQKWSHLGKPARADTTSPSNNLTLSFLYHTSAIKPFTWDNTSSKVWVLQVRPQAAQWWPSHYQKQIHRSCG